MRNLNDVKYLIGHWPLNNNVKDVSGHGNHGTEVDGTIVYEEGPFGRSVWAKDDVEYVNCGHASVLNVANQLTMSCWISEQYSGHGFYIYAIAKRDNSGNNGFNIFVADNGTSLSVVDGAGTVQPLDSSLDFTTSTPTHVIVTISGSNATLYINGEYVNSVTITPLEFVPDTDVYLGNREGAAYTGPYKLWGVRLYNIALTGDEAKRLYDIERRQIK